MTKKVQLRHIMKDAHELAHDIEGRVGDYRIAFTISLRLAWQYRKEADHSQYFFRWAQCQLKPTAVAGVPTWAIEKDFRGFDATIIIYHTESTEIVRETAKAVQIQFNIYNADDCDYRGTRTAWVAKSIMVA